MSDTPAFPQPGQTYVPLEGGQAVSIHAWRCPNCQNLNGISVPVGVPIDQPLAVQCDECQAHCAHIRGKLKIPGRRFIHVCGKKQDVLYCLKPARHDGDCEFGEPHVKTQLE